jgi:predicted metal-dependent hydrolase
MVEATTFKVHPIPVRQPRIDFGQGLGPCYLRNNMVTSHFVSGVKLCFPDGEKFFVESVMPFKNRIRDPQLKMEIKNFCGQELQHKNQHEAFSQVLTAAGYHLESWRKKIRWYHTKFLKFLPKGFQLAYTAGCEHLTATFAHAALKNGTLENAHPAMRKLLLWHSIEGIEHKHVAFNVFQEIYPKNYLLRISGFLLGFTAVNWFAWYGLFKLLWQDYKAGRSSFKEIRDQWMKMMRDSVSGAFLKDLYVFSAKYLKPGFHPNQINDRPFLEQYLPELEEFS